jgi:Zn-dependent peptidase ImmA (M78 family)
MAVRRKFVRKLVTDLLAKNGITAPQVPVERIVVALGAELRVEPAEPDLSGFLLRDVERNKAIIGVNRSQAVVRRRFTIAHEIGHLLLHEGERVHVDRTDRIFRIKLRNAESSLGTNVEEQEANLFASELLMPEAFIERDLADSTSDLDIENADAILAMARRYRVSVQALTFRLAYLGYSVG